MYNPESYISMNSGGDSPLVVAVKTKANKDNLPKINSKGEFVFSFTNSHCWPELDESVQ